MTNGRTTSAAPARAARRRGWTRLWQMPLFLAGVFAFASVAATTPLRDDPLRAFDRELRSLRKNLRDDVADLDADLARLEAELPADAKRQAEFHFLAGSHWRRRSDRDPGDADAQRKAGEHLTRALSLGVSEIDQPNLQLRLGVTHYRQGGHPAQALAWIKQGLDLGADDPAQGYAFLAEAHLKEARPNWNAALAASLKRLEYVDERDPRATAHARLTHAEILVKLERRSDAMRELEWIDDAAPKPLVAQARLLHAECAEAEGAYAKALESWTRLLPLAHEVPGGAGRIRWALGRVETKLDPPDATAATKHWTEAIRAGGEPGQAAALLLGKMLLFGDRADADGALGHWTRALHGVRVPADYQNRYVPLAEIQGAFDQARVRFVERKEFSRALQVVELMGRTSSLGAGDEKRAVVSEAWARHLEAQLAKTPAERKEAFQREVWGKFQNAGDDLAQAALSREAKEKADLYWRASSCYLAGKDYVKATMVLEKFVALAAASAKSGPGSDARLAQGHFSLAETYLAQAARDKAKSHFHKCIELDASPYVHRARYRLAEVETEAKNFDAAREILTQIMQRIGPDVERGLHENALYLLAKVLYERNDYDEAAIRLREAVRRFPNHPAAIASTDRLAKIYWEIKAKRIEITEPTSPERKVLADKKRAQRREHLLEALKIYEDLERDLKQQSETRKFSAEDMIVWRDALFNIGRIKGDLEEHVAAVEHFRTVQRRYRGYVESLYASHHLRYHWQLALRRDDQFTPEESERIHGLASDALQDAFEDLDKRPNDRDQETFNSPAGLSRDEWRQHLREWESELRRRSTRAAPMTFAPEP